ncbi:sigma-70 family RNA polymerase sigma factor [Staphylococcus equorum]|uniref:sigma-70 family RNA polymerase sigma factor n=1 Tax=Staphylococcus equorum TaxID=246432 RepID=UPI003D808A41
MRYDKATVKEFILNYHKIQDKSFSCEDVGIDDFFNVNDQAEANEIDNSNVEDVIFFNELEAVVESVATEKEHNLFLLLSNGVSFEKAGSIFGVEAPRVRQMLNTLLDKLGSHHGSIMSFGFRKKSN